MAIDELEKTQRRRLWHNEGTYADIFEARLIESKGNFRAASVSAIFDPSISPFQVQHVTFTPVGLVLQC